MIRKGMTNDQLRQLFRLDQEVIDVEEDGERLRPVVRTYDDGRQLRFWCIHCRCWHFHGRGGADARYEEGRGGMAGDRSAHCFVDNSPFLQNGIILHVVGKFSDTLKKQHKTGKELYCPICRNRYSAALNACNCGGKFINKKRTSSHPDLAEVYQRFLAHSTP